MPWKATSPVEQRKELIKALLSRHPPTKVELAAQLGVSEKTVHKWVRRFEADGPAGLENRSRRPHSSPTQTPEQVRDAIIAFRKQHAHWGAKKLLDVMAELSPQLRLPAPSTAGEILKRAGLTTPRRRSNRRGRNVQPIADPKKPNDLWCTDHKGDFTVERHRCYPLTLADSVSRFFLGCRACRSTADAEARPPMDAAFREYGLPSGLLSDNGPPFGARGLCGFSRMTVYLTHLGIRHYFIDPGEPQQNGRLERLHRTLKAEAVLPPGATWRQQQRAFDRFRQEYNFERPHEALRMKRPADVYTPSKRLFPAHLPELAYPTSFAVRRVKHTGEISWRGLHIFVSETLRREDLGIIESEIDGWWRLYFGPWDLGLLSADGILLGRKRALWTTDTGSPMSPV